MNIGMIPAKFAMLAPDGDALVDRSTGTRITFSQLDEHVRRLANGLQSLGLTRGDRVAILAQNCTEILALIFACGRTGIVAQPLNWRLSAAALAEVLNDAEPKALIAQQQYAAEVSELQSLTKITHWLAFGCDSDGSYERLIDEASDAEPVPAEPILDDDPLYILYTGGTTGKSKGVLHSHRSTFMAIMTNISVERIGGGDVYLQLGPMFHSPVVMALTYLACGCPVVLMTFEAREALRIVQEEQVTAFLAQTTMIIQMLALDDFDSYDLTSLRHIEYGGAPIPLVVVREAIQRFNCNFLGVYGQTEGLIMTCLDYRDHIDAINGIRPERLMSCGRETMLTRLLVVDEDGQPVPRDRETPGQIIVQSEANMMEYWRKPEITAETIRGDWMWTGDVATWDEDGYVFIVDRAKDMIISGGENIYAAQVENAIFQHPAVQQAAVIGIPDDVWGEAVLAFVVLKANMAATETDIIDAAKQYLASYQKPRRIEFIDALPISPTGKVMKHVLRKPFWDGRGRQV